MSWIQNPKNNEERDKFIFWIYEKFNVLLCWILFFWNISFK